MGKSTVKLICLNLELLSHYLSHYLLGRHVFPQCNKLGVYQFNESFLAQNDLLKATNIRTQLLWAKMTCKPTYPTKMVPSLKMIFRVYITIP